MRSYMARLGDFMFSIDTAAFQELQRRSSYDWKEVERIGRKPARQFTGPGSDTITLQGVILPHYRGGLGQISRMRVLAGRGEPLPFIYCSEFAGQYLGDWCILDITEGRSVFFHDGAPRKIEFSLTIGEYGEDLI